MRDVAFRAADFGIARLPLLPAEYPVPRPPGDLDSTEETRDFLRRLAADPVVREAIAVSSGPLDAILEKVASGVPVEPPRLRRAAISAARYLSRMTSRATPFGLMAGVAAVHVEDEPKVRMEGRHRRRVRADMGWLTGVVRGWETEPAVLSRLRLVANDLCGVRGDRLVLPYMLDSGGRDPDEDWAPDDRERTIRHTRAVRLAMAAARTPVRHPDLVSRLAAEFGDVDRSVIERMVAALVEGEFLLTDLRPPADAEDPVDHVLGVMAALPEHPGRAALAEVRDALGAYQATPIGEGHAAWRRATAMMRALRAGDRPIQVDMEMNADIVLPRDVVAELERAASVAWRVAPPKDGRSDRLGDYRMRFVERYGVDVAVPVKEVIDPQLGIGAPGGYLLPPGGAPKRDHHPAAEPNERDALLCALAQRAAADGAREIVLDDELVGRLTRPGAAEEPASYVEAAVQILAESEDDLRDGDFHLALATPMMNRPGAMFGRFLHLLPGLRSDFAALVRDITADEDRGSGGTPDGAADGASAIAAQLQSIVLRPRVLNVTQVPTLTGTTVRAGVFADRARPDVLGLDDLAVSADYDRFKVVATRTGREVVPLPFHALNPTLTLPNALRLLAEIGEERTRPWPLWNWGLANRLPYLPRVRHGRTVLAPARWLPDPRLADSGLSPHEWTRCFDRWRAGWTPPDVVYAVSGDHRLRLDLSSAAGRRLLRDELLKRPGAVLEEEPLGGAVGTGWLNGHAHEIVVPLRPARPRQAAPAPAARSAGRTPIAVRRAHQPGGEWLYVKVHAAEGRHGELLTRHLPALVEQAAPVCDRWFFMRYRDDEPHLRVRFHGEPAALNGRLLPVVHRWAAALADGGLIRDVVLDAYRPEIARYGGPELIEAAERVFWADSVSVIEQLVLRSQGLLDLPLELLAAANHLDLAARLHGHGWREWMLDAYPKGAHHSAFQKRRREAMRLLGTAGDGGELARLPGGDRLLDGWRRRAPHVAAYGRLVRAKAAEGVLETVTGPFSSVLHLHHNRIAGIDHSAEGAATAIARGVLQAELDRERHRDRTKN
ncbi:lantibiotic dehydratase [Actinomadura sp. NPDC047616]|uniref:lantibiotic dehydratase n=1 Tax=Actinomadura sp. NPDC047616 TaxID=3155914 RepID=UPI0034078708